MIGSLLSRMDAAQNLSPQQLQQAIKDGTIPAYVGIPLLQDKIAQQKAAQTQQAPQQPPIAQQVMDEAKGLNSIPSNLPVHAAGGGIMGFAAGDLIDDDEDEAEEARQYEQALSMMGNPMGEAYIPSMISGTTPSASPSIGSRISQGIKDIKGNADKVFDFIMSKEGGFTNHPADKGGPTNMGVTQKTLSSYLGRDASVDDVKNLDRGTAKDIFKTMFWNPMGADKLDPKTAALAVDTAWGSGHGKAKEMLNKYGDNVDKFLQAKEDYYRQIAKNNPSQKTFLKGWLNRNNDLGNFVNTSFAEGGIASLAEGGHVKHFQYGGTSNVPSGSLQPGFNPADVNFLDAPTISDKVNPANINEPSNQLNIPRQFVPVAKPTPGSVATRYPIVPYVAPKTPSFMDQLRRYGRSDEYSNTYPVPTNTGGIADLNYFNLLQEEIKKHPNDTNLTSERDALIQRFPGLENQSDIQKNIALNKKYKPYDPSQAYESNFPVQQNLSTDPDVNLRNGNPNYYQGSDGRVYAHAGDPLDPTQRGEWVRDIELGIKKENASKASTNAVVNPQANAVDPTSSTSATTPSATPSSTTTDSSGIAALQPSTEFQNFMSGLKSKQEQVDKQKDEDKYMALLAAGLGMMSGTSPYAAQNIGQGALAGVQNYMQAQKERAVQQANIDKLIATAIRYEQLDKLGRESLYQRALDRKAEIDARLQVANLSSQDRQDLLAERKRNDDLLDQTRREALGDKRSAKNKDIISQMQKNAQTAAQADLKLSQTQLSMMTPEQISALSAAGVQRRLNNKMYRDLHKEEYGYDPFENETMVAPGISLDAIKAEKERRKKESNQ